jgi:hypothetical protein
VVRAADKRETPAHASKPCSPDGMNFPSVKPPRV